MQEILKHVEVACPENVIDLTNTTDEIWPNLEAKPECFEVSSIIAADNRSIVETNK
jgi:hypothetical protein